MGRIELTNDSSLLAKENNKQFIKAPVARIGVWEHPQYGKVEFSQKDFDDMVANWKNNVAGFEPPLYLGHPEDDGAPAVGFLDKLIQEGETLFGYYEPVDESAFKEVEEGKYRYASAEVYRNATSKQDASPIGTLLTAHALTNEPFLTKLPRVEVTELQQFSDPLSTTRFVFSQVSTTDVEETYINTVMPQTIETTTETATVVPEPKANVLDPELEKLVEENKVLRQELSDRNAQITELGSKVAQLEQVLSAHTANFKRQELSQKLERLNKMNVTAATKETYSQKLREGISEESEELMWNFLKDIEASNVQKFTQPRGNLTESNVDTVENPFAATLAQLQERAAELKRPFAV